MPSNKNRPKEPTETPVEATPVEEDTAIRERLYKDTYDELVKKQVSNSENFDRSVLTLSASALGFSLAFVKDFAPLAKADVRWLLVLSWCLFGAAVISTMASYLTSQEAIRQQMIAAEQYYVRHDESAFNESLASKLTSRLNLFSGIAFILGIVLTIIFVVLNLPSPKP